MNVSPTIVWFREDFRLADNQALHEATLLGQPLICLVMLDDAASMGAAAQWWLDGAIHALAADLRAKGGDLHVLRGPARRVVESVAQTTGAGAVFNCCAVTPGESVAVIGCGGIVLAAVNAPISRELFPLPLMPITIFILGFSGISAFSKFLKFFKVRLSIRIAASFQNPDFMRIDRPSTR